MITNDIRFDRDGLIPGVVQDVATGRVLMLGYLNAEALARTEATGDVHFWSRSRRELWRKGATSGNVLRVTHIAVDCDGDALLIRAAPAGPTCHTGATSCFGEAANGPPSGFRSLDALWATILQRAANRPTGSYTATLLKGGVDEIGRKVLEEAGEVLVAAKNHAAGTGAEDRIHEEAADLVYHLLVLLAERNLTPAGMLDVLTARAAPHAPTE